MRTIIQRVSQAAVDVDGQTVAAIGRGLVALIGIEAADTEAQLSWTADKLANLRIFEDVDGKMNLSILDLARDNTSKTNHSPESSGGPAILLIPNFTLAGDARKGRRPSFDQAMRPELAEPMFEQLASHLRTLAIHIETGIFRAHMHVHLTNDGPVTIILETPREPA